MKAISETSAMKLISVLTAKLGTPEGNSGCIRGRFETESTWRFRIDDGSSLARLGFGETRKMVTLKTTQSISNPKEVSYKISIWKK